MNVRNKLECWLLALLTDIWKYEKTWCDKHSSLFGTSIRDEEKSFRGLTPGPNFIKHKLLMFIISQSVSPDMPLEPSLMFVDKAMSLP